MDTFDVLVTGPLSVDVIFSSIPKLPDVGEEVYCDDFEFTCGASYNTAVALARLGLKVAVAAPIGNDFLSQFIETNLQKEGVITDHLIHLEQPARVLSVALNYGGDRSFVSYQDSMEAFDYEAYVNTIIAKTNARALYVSINESAHSFMKAAKRKNWCVFQDVGWDEEWLQNARLHDLIRMGDYFLPNAKEAAKITSEQEDETALEQLSAIHPNGTVIIKLGEEGAMVQQGSKQSRIPTIKKSVKDTTGAGDVFVAGFIAGVLRGYTDTEAIQIGNYCGGCSVEGLGGTKTSPTWEQVKSVLFNN